METYKSKEEFEEDIKTWKTGDIFLQCSADSPHTQIMTDSPWTHCGLIYRRDDICKQRGQFYPDSELMIVEAIISVMDKEFNKIKIEKFALMDVKHKFNYLLWNEETSKKYYSGYYCAHRRLGTELTESQKQKFEDAVVKILDNKYGGNTRNDMAAYGAAIDLSCFYCPKSKCCEGQTTEKSLEQLFCSEAVGYLLQQVGILRDDFAADEFMPKDCSSEKMFAYCVEYKDLYGPETIYG